MTNANDFSPEMQDVMTRIQKLLNLAAKNPSAEEAASAAAKAQELMTKFNLDVATIEKQTGKAEGRREEMKVEGGFYTYQRNLWTAVAKMNFCLYWTQDYWGVRDKTIKRKSDSHWSGERVYEKGSQVMKKRHRIIGRQVNTANTKALAGYLEQCIERSIREKLTRSDGTGTSIDYGQLYSRWGISYREGAVDRLLEKIDEQIAKDERKLDAERKAAAKRATMSGSSSSTTLTVSQYRDSEWDANVDFVYGDGTSARWAQERAEAAAKQKLYMEQMAKLAEENPEAYRAKMEERRKERRSSSSYRSPRTKDVDYGAFRAGYEAAEKISLHQQVDTGSKIAGRLK